MTAANAIRSSIEPIPPTLTIREAAKATGTNARSIRRRLAAGAFPGAYKGTDPEQPDTLVWRIPVDELEGAGLGPVDLTIATGRELESAVPESATPSAGILIGTDRFARLRSELAEAVASAELALLRAEAEKWRAVADERGSALERADIALQTLSSALGPRSETTTETTPAAPSLSDAPSSADAPHAGATGGDDRVAAVPPYIRSEAVLYAESMAARGRSRPDRKSRWRRRR